MADMPTTQPVDPNTQVRGYLDKIASSPDYQALTPEGQRHLRDVAYNNDIVPFYKSLNQEAPARDIFEPGYVDPRTQYQPDNVARFGVATLKGAGTLLSNAEKLSPGNYIPKIMNSVFDKASDFLPEGKLKTATKDAVAQNRQAQDLKDKIFNYPKNVAQEFQDAFPDTTLGNKLSSLGGDLLGRAPGFMLVNKVVGSVPVFAKLIDPKTATYASKVLYAAIDGATSAPVAGDNGIEDAPIYAALGIVGTGVGIGAWRGAKSLFTGIASLGTKASTQILTNAAHLAEGNVAEGTSKFTDFMHYNEDQLTKAFPNTSTGGPTIDHLNLVAQDKFKKGFLQLSGFEQLQVFRGLGINLSVPLQQNMQVIDTVSAAVAKGYDLIANQRFNKAFKDLGITEKKAVVDEAATFLKQVSQAPDPKVAAVAAAAQMEKSANINPIAQQTRTRVNTVLQKFGQPTVEEAAAKEAERVANLSQAKEMVQADNPTVSESFNTVQAQLSSLVDGNKESVYIPKGTQYDPTLIPKKLADGRTIKQTPFKNGVRLTIKGAKEVSQDLSTTTDAAAQNILGQDENKEQVLANAIKTGQPVVTVVAENKGTGDELETALATPQTAASEVQRLTKNFPSAEIKVGDENKAAQIIQNRVDRSVPSNEPSRMLSNDEIKIAQAKIGSIENVTGKPVKLSSNSPTQLIKDVLNAGGAHFNGVSNNTSLMVNGKLTPVSKSVSIGHVMVDESGAPMFMTIGDKKLLMTSHGEENVSGLTVSKVQQWIAERVNKSMKTAANIKSNPAAAEQSGINVTAAIGMGTRHYGIDDITKSIILRGMGIVDGSAKNVAPEQVEEVLNQFMRQNLQSNSWHWTGEVFGDIPVLSNLPQKDATIKYGFSKDIGKVLDIDSNMNDKFAALLIENFPDIVNTYGPSRNKIFSALKDASSINPTKYRDFNFASWLKEQGYDAVMMRPDKSQIKVVPINSDILDNQAIKEAEQTVLNLKAIKLDGVDKASAGAMAAINTVKDMAATTQAQKVKVAVYNQSGKLTGYKEIDVPVPVGSKPKVSGLTDSEKATMESYQKTVGEFGKSFSDLMDAKKKFIEKHGAQAFQDLLDAHEAKK